MKDSVERLKDKGNSALLFHIAESIGSVAESTGVSESVNVINATVLNGVSGGEKRGSVSKANRVFQIAGEGTSFRTPTIADCDGSYIIL